MSGETAKRWNLIDRHLTRLLDMPAPARDLELLSIDHCDSALASRLRNLLAHACNDSPLTQPLLARTLLDSLRQRFAEPTPEQLGDWRLLHPLGTGGMADVYLAERRDGLILQRAALKLIRTACGPEMRTRFLREQRILARLTDPRIARYYEGGVAADGRLWLAMEFVDGATLSQHCDAKRLDLAARLRVFVELGTAVAHAHRHLIVHRDIKPSNVMVDRCGQLKLLDFGIAKLLDDSESDATQTHARTLTPGYASPEQIAGAPASIATDVFSLGVLLHELLVGERPRAERCSSRDGVPTPLHDQNIVLPSTCLAHRLATQGAAENWPIRARSLRGDLDRIILKALREEPQDRYSSVERLVDDIDCHLNLRPVSARNGALSYRARKLFARHRVASLAAGMALLVAMASAAALVDQAREVRAQRDLAQRQMNSAEATRDFLIGLFDQADPGKTLGEKLTVGALLDRGSERLEHGFDGEAGIRADMLTTLGRVYRARGNFSRARELLQQAIAFRSDLALDGMRARGFAELAGLERDDGQLARAAELAELALRWSNNDPRARAMAMYEAGSVALLRESGDLDHIELQLLQAATAFRLLSPPDLIQAAIADGNRAIVAYRRGDQTSAEAGYRAALAVLAPRLGDSHPEVTALLYNLARLEELRENHDAAAALLDRVLAVEIRVLGPNHPDVAIDLTRLAYVNLRRGRHAIALEGFQTALAILRRSVAVDHKRIAENLIGHAETLLALGRAESAQPMIDEAISILIRHFGADHSRVARAEQVKAMIESGQGSAALACGRLARIAPVLNAEPAPAPQNLQKTIEKLGCR